METEEYYQQKEETLRQKYVRAGIERAKREVALEKKIDELLRTKKELFKFIDKLKPQNDGKIRID
jgi:hypothetical protein